MPGYKPVSRSFQIIPPVQSAFGVRRDRNQSIRQTSDYRTLDAWFTSLFCPEGKALLWGIPSQLPCTSIMPHREEDVDGHAKLPKFSIHFPGIPSWFYIGLDAVPSQQVSRVLTEVFLSIYIFKLSFSVKEGEASASSSAILLMSLCGIVFHNMIAHSKLICFINSYFHKLIFLKIEYATMRVIASRSLSLSEEPTPVVIAVP